RRRHTRSKRDWSSDVCSSDLLSEGVSQLLRRDGLRLKGVLPLRGGALRGSGTLGEGISDACGGLTGHILIERIALFPGAGGKGVQLPLSGNVLPPGRFSFSFISAQHTLLFILSESSSRRDLQPSRRLRVAAAGGAASSVRRAAVGGPSGLIPGICRAVTGGSAGITAAPLVRQDGLRRKLRFPAAVTRVVRGPAGLRAGGRPTAAVGVRRGPIFRLGVSGGTALRSRVRGTAAGTAIPSPAPR